MVTVNPPETISSDLPATGLVTDHDILTPQLDLPKDTVQLELSIKIVPDSGERTTTGINAVVLTPVPVLSSVPDGDIVCNQK